MRYSIYNTPTATKGQDVDEIDGMMVAEDDQMLARLEELTMSRDESVMWDMDDLASQLELLWDRRPELAEIRDFLSEMSDEQAEALWAYAKLGRNVFIRNRREDSESWPNGTP